MPSISIAGIPLGARVEDIECALARYLVDESKRLYQFEKSPVLMLKTYGVDERGSGGCSFSLYDDKDVNVLLKGTPALSLMFRESRVYAVKVYDFSFCGERARDFVYKGLFSEIIGLGNLVSDLLSLTCLYFDDVEEWFDIEKAHGGLEVTGWGVPLDEQPDQVITAFCVIHK